MNERNKWLTVHQTPHRKARERNEGVGGTLTFFHLARTDRRADQMLSLGESFSFAVRPESGLTAAGKSKTPVARSRFRRELSGSGSRLRDRRRRARATLADDALPMFPAAAAAETGPSHIPIRQKDLSDA